MLVARANSMLSDVTCSVKITDVKVWLIQNKNVLEIFLEQKHKNSKNI
jgi:hypothetical protein